MSLRLKLALSLLCLFSNLPAKANASAPAKSLVTIVCSCDDSTGKAYAKALSAALSTNSLYKEVSAEEGAEKDAIRINIISMPLASDGTSRPKSALSIVAMHQGALLHQFIETCDRIPIEQCAQSLVASLQEWDSAI